jgi:hypothetical protein
MTTALFQEPAAQPEPGAADVPQDDGPSAEAPYGWTTDAETGLRRPKKAPGRRPKGAAAPKVPGLSPALDELKAQAQDRKPVEDVAPAAAKAERLSGRFALKAPSAAKAPEPVPPFRAGPIAKGVNKLYRRAGKIVKIWDSEVGRAIVACTVKDEDDDDDITVGEAWEELARTNPRIRAFLTKFITAGAVSTLVAAHAPIMVAVMLKDGIRRRIPLLKVVDAFLVDDDDDGMPYPSDLAQAMGGIGPEDMAQMMQVAQQMMNSMADHLPRNMNDAREDAA